MKKIIVMITVILTVALGLAGCGGGDSKTASSGGDGEKYKFVISHSMADDTSFGLSLIHI